MKNNNKTKGSTTPKTTIEEVKKNILSEKEKIEKQSKEERDKRAIECGKAIDEVLKQYDCTLATSVRPSGVNNFQAFAYVLAK